MIYEAKKLPVPQDFRYLVFSLKTLLNRDDVVNKHILDIQNTCVVKRDTEMTNKLYLLTENGIKCTVNLNSCYPQVSIICNIYIYMLICEYIIWLYVMYSIYIFVCIVIYMIHIHFTYYYLVTITFIPYNIYNCLDLGAWRCHCGILINF